MAHVVVNDLALRLSLLWLLVVLTGTIPCFADYQRSFPRFPPLRRGVISFEFSRTNMMGTHVLLEAAKEIGIKRFIHVSSDEACGGFTLFWEAVLCVCGGGCVCVSACLAICSCVVGWPVSWLRSILTAISTWQVYGEVELHDKPLTEDCKLDPTQVCHVVGRMARSPAPRFLDRSFPLSLFATPYLTPGSLMRQPRRHRSTWRWPIIAPTDCR